MSPPETQPRDVCFVLVEVHRLLLAVATPEHQIALSQTPCCLPQATFTNTTATVKHKTEQRNMKHLNVYKMI